MAEDDNEVIPELEETGNDRAVADDEGMDDEEFDDNESELSDDDNQKAKDGTGF